jgi:hypothetical protein
MPSLSRVEKRAHSCDYFIGHLKILRFKTLIYTRHHKLRNKTNLQRRQVNGVQVKKRNKKKKRKRESVKSELCSFKGLSLKGSGKYF